MTISFTSGEELLAAKMNLLCPVLAVLSSDQTYTNTTTPASATDLSFTLLANTTYVLELHAGATSSATGHGLALAYTTTGTVALGSGLRLGNGPSTSGTTQSTSTSMHAYLYNALGAVTYGTDTAAISSGVSGITEYLTLVGGLSGGTITLQGAQATAGAATTTTLKAGTWAILRAVA